VCGNGRLRFKTHNFEDPDVFTSSGEMTTGGESTPVGPLETVAITEKLQDSFSL
jgi:hypothetical protein